MSVKSKQVNGKWRVVDPDGSVAKNAAGTALDGGGHKFREQAIKQAEAVNISLHKEGKV